MAKFYPDYIPRQHKVNEDAVLELFDKIGAAFLQDCRDAEIGSGKNSSSQKCSEWLRFALMTVPFPRTRDLLRAEMARLKGK